MSDETIKQYYNILGKIEQLNAEDIMNDPHKLELLNKLQHTVGELEKLYNISDEKFEE